MNLAVKKFTIKSLIAAVATFLEHRTRSLAGSEIQSKNLNLIATTRFIL